MFACIKTFYPHYLIYTYMCVYVLACTVYLPLTMAAAATLYTLSCVEFGWKTLSY